MILEFKVFGNLIGMDKIELERQYDVKVLIISEGAVSSGLQLDKIKEGCYLKVSGEYDKAVNLMRIASTISKKTCSEPEKADEKKELIGWTHGGIVESMCFQYDYVGGKLIMRSIFNKRRNFLKEYPNCNCMKVRITIEKIK